MSAQSLFDELASTTNLSSRSSKLSAWFERESGWSFSNAEFAKIFGYFTDNSATMSSIVSTVTEHLGSTSCEAVAEVIVQCSNLSAKMSMIDKFIECDAIRDKDDFEARLKVYEVIAADGNSATLGACRSKLGDDSDPEWCRELVDKCSGSAGASDGGGGAADDAEMRYERQDGDVDEASDDASDAEDQAAIEAASAAANSAGVPPHVVEEWKVFFENAKKEEPVYPTQAKVRKSAQVRKEGWLYKLKPGASMPGVPDLFRRALHRVAPKWTKRYCVLLESGVMYYGSEQSPSTLQRGLLVVVGGKAGMGGTVSFNQGVISVTRHSMREIEFTSKMARKPGRPAPSVWELAADKPEADAWVEALNRSFSPTKKAHAPVLAVPKMVMAPVALALPEVVLQVPSVTVEATDGGVKIDVGGMKVEMAETEGGVTVEVDGEGMVMGGVSMDMAGITSSSTTTATTTTTTTTTSVDGVTTSETTTETVEAGEW